jgi:hypothetical protein
VQRLISISFEFALTEREATKKGERQAIVGAKGACQAKRAS